VHATDAGVAPFVLELFTARAAQLVVAGDVVRLAAVLRQGEQYAAAAAAPPASYPGARGFVAYVDAAEAVQTPGLVATFASVFDGKADATLVLGGRGWADDRLAAELGPLIDGLGMDDCPDLLATSAVPADLGDRVQVVLSSRPPRPGLARVPHVRDGQAARLRTIALDVAARAGA
jgi:hypothetical protein